MNYEKCQYLSVQAASILSGLSIQTIRRFVDEGKITAYRTPAGQRRISRHDIEQMLTSTSNAASKSTDGKRNFTYSRVSSPHQLEDLKRQTEFIRSSDTKYSSYIHLQDVGSGINFKRKGLHAILDSCIQGDIGELVIAHKDRLSRFGFDLIRLFVEKAGGTITILDEKDNGSSTHKSTEQELAEDLLAIVQIYSCRTNAGTGTGGTGGEGGEGGECGEGGEGGGGGEGGESGESGEEKRGEKRGGPRQDNKRSGRGGRKKEEKGRGEKEYGNKNEKD